MRWFASDDGAAVAGLGCGWATSGTFEVAAASYDAVVNFGAIHHVDRWREAIGEIFRVLKPGGVFYCEEILSRYITHPLLGRLMDHPQEDRFNTPQFIYALQQNGFLIHGYRQLAHLYLWVVAIRPHGK